MGAARRETARASCSSFTAGSVARRTPRTQLSSPGSSASAASASTAQRSGPKPTLRGPLSRPLTKKRCPVPSAPKENALRSFGSAAVLCTRRTSGAGGCRRILPPRQACRCGRVGPGTPCATLTEDDDAVANVATTTPTPPKTTTAATVPRALNAAAQVRRLGVIPSLRMASSCEAFRGGCGGVKGALS